MATEDPTPGRCNAKAWLNQGEREDPDSSKSGFCESFPVGGEGADNTCRMHFGTASRDGVQGAGEGNGNAITHGATASPINLLDHLEDEEVGWIGSLVNGYIEHAPFGYEDPRRERLTKICVWIYQEWSAAETVLSEGVTQEQPVGVNDDGNPVLRDEEHHLASRERKLNNKVRQNLKDLGCMPGHSAAESSGETVAQVFEAAVDRAKEKEPDTEVIEADGGVPE